MAGSGEIEDSLGRFDTSTQEEARKASAELLKTTHSVDGRVKDVAGQVQDVRGDVQDVRVDVHDAHDDLRDVGNMVQDVDDKLDQANHSSSL